MQRTVLQSGCLSAAPIRRSSTISAQLRPSLALSSLRKCNHLTGTCLCHGSSRKVAQRGSLAVTNIASNGIAPVTPPTNPQPRHTRDKDTLKEAARQYRRTVFDFDDWAHHRTNRRFLRHMLGMLTSRVVWGLAGPVAYAVSVATGVCLYQSALTAGLLADFMPDLAVKTLGPFTLSSFALSLLLVFRTNASYERWDGARKMWGLVVNRSRDLGRQGLVWIKDPALRDAHARWTKAISKSMTAHFRTDREMAEMLTGVLTPKEIEMVCKAGHGPHAVLNVLTMIQDKAGLDIAQKRSMDVNITNFSDCIGGCERILRTPIPLSYTRHTSRFLILWLTFVPFTLWDTCGWATIFYAGITAFLLLGIEEIGVSIEEPFSILPLETISATIERNITGMMTYDDVKVQDVLSDIEASSTVKETISV